MINEVKKLNVIDDRLDNGFTTFIVYKESIYVFNYLYNDKFKKDFTNFLNDIKSDIGDKDTYECQRIDTYLSIINSPDGFEASDDFIRGVAKELSILTVFIYSTNSFSKNIPKDEGYLELLPNMYVNKILSNQFKKSLSYLSYNIKYILFNSEFYLVDDIIGNKVSTKYVYHGTCLSNALKIVKIGIIPNYDNSNFRNIRHSEYVFIATDKTIAKKYGDWAISNKKISFKIGDKKLYDVPVVIEIDFSKLDKYKLEYDYDYYRMFKSNVYVKSYDELINSDDYEGVNSVFHSYKSRFRDLIKFGYKGRILPNRITKLIVYENISSSIGVEYTLSEFINKYLNENK